MNVASSVSEVLKNVQETTATHQRCLGGLSKIFSESDYIEFLEAFKKCLLYMFIHDSKEDNMYIIRCLNFCAKFCTSYENKQSKSDTLMESQFLLDTCNFLSKIHGFDFPAGRFRCCHLLGSMLSEMIDKEMSETLYNEIEHILLIRVMDVKHFVRHAAINALKFFQDPRDPEDPVTEAFINRFGDSNSRVRAAIVDVINPRPDVLPLLIARTRDTDLTVRYTAYKRFVRIPITCLKIVQRQKLLEHILLENNPKIHTLIIEKIIPFWLESYDNDRIQFLTGLRLDDDELSTERSIRLMEGIIKFLYKMHSIKDAIKHLLLNNLNLVPIENLSWEMAVYWKTVLSCIKAEETSVQDAVEEVFPSLVDFCEYINIFYELKQTAELNQVEYNHYQIILQQLLQITLVSDAMDEASRRALQNSTKQLLQKANLSIKTVDKVMENVHKVLPNIDRKIDFICNILSNIQLPLCEESIKLQKEKELEVSKQKEQIILLKHELHDVVKNEDYKRAEFLKTDIALREEQLEMANLQLKDIKVVEEKSDVYTLCKCLDIIDSLLRLIPLQTELLPGLQSLKVTFTRSLLIHLDSNVRSRALKCFALFCLGDLQEAQKQLPIFCAPLTAYREKGCDVETALISIKIVVDLLGIYGSALIDIPEDANNIHSESDCETTTAVFRGGVCLTEIIQILVDMMMNDEEPEIRKFAGFGLTTLFAVGRISSPSVLSRLILKWCYPYGGGDEDEKADLELRQRIGKMLEFFNHEGDDEFADKLMKAYITVMKILVNAPRTSPYADVSAENISKLLLEIYRNCSKIRDCDRPFAADLLNEMISHPENKCVLLFSKVLLNLRYANIDRGTMNDYLKCCNILCDSVKNKMAIKNISKLELVFQKVLIDISSKLTDIPEEAIDETGQNSVNLPYTNTFETSENDRNGNNPVQSEDESE